ncbi:Cytochrome P450 52A13 [Sphaceloma murrayae]|uniref:Cytochrome P450 52A13 n=1 Tax=Sphaceloma murrayae TaxID=2082308 RepID=A0A2K1QGR6_9PEZI|nr:Cytochrome P450 52A13 [Sphaceloma murrayae]
MLAGLILVSLLLGALCTRLHGVLLRKDPEAPALLQRVLSRVLNAVLVRLYPIKDLDGVRDIPSLPYQWPDGQGDKAKFLDGSRNYSQWREELGPIYRIWNGMTPEVVIADPTPLQTLFRDSDTHIKASNNNSGYIMGELLGSCLGLISGSEWKSLRTTLEPHFSHVTVSNSSLKIFNAAQRHLATLEVSKNFQAGFIHPSNDARVFLFDTSADLIYGGLSPEERAGLWRLVPPRESLFESVMDGGISRFDLSRVFEMPVHRKLKTYLSDFANFNHQVYQRKVATKGDLGLLEHYAKSNTNVKQLLQTIDESLFANLDVVTGAMSWLIYNLAKHRAAQAQLAEEVQLHTREDDASWIAYIMRDDTFLSACIRESARLSPIASFSIPQAPPTDRKAGEWILPAKTNITIDTRAINIEDPFWGKDRTEFNPSRFLDMKKSDVSTIRQSPSGQVQRC